MLPMYPLHVIFLMVHVSCSVDWCAYLADHTVYLAGILRLQIECFYWFWKKLQC